MAQVFYNNILAGELQKSPEGYTFIYNDDYFKSPDMPPVSLTLPKNERIQHSDILFPFFFGLLAEGSNKVIQCRVLKIDENDHFTRLLKTAHTDTIGAVTIKE